MSPEKRERISACGRVSQLGSKLVTRIARNKTCVVGKCRFSSIHVPLSYHMASRDPPIGPSDAFSSGRRETMTDKNA